MCVKLLIADDEDMIRNGIAKYIKLHTDRYETIYLAKNGQEALDIIYPPQAGYHASGCPDAAQGRN